MHYLSGNQGVHGNFLRHVLIFVSVGYLMSSLLTVSFSKGQYDQEKERRSSPTSDSANLTAKE